MTQRGIHRRPTPALSPDESAHGSRFECVAGARGALLRALNIGDDEHYQSDHQGGPRGASEQWPCLCDEQALLGEQARPFEKAHVDLGVDAVAVEDAKPAWRTLGLLLAELTRALEQTLANGFGGTLGAAGFAHFVETLARFGERGFGAHGAVPSDTAAHGAAVAGRPSLSHD
ncbi:MAG TPA: hypothetical protein VMG12_42805, partial [Polyangiaceae bacterium]|nr:hypothetical protein [Polyangiaceae bacterium]